MTNVEDGGRWVRAVADTVRQRGPLILLLVCVAVLGFHALCGVLVTRDVAGGAWRDRADVLEGQDACLAAATDALVPEGSQVHLAAPGGELDLKLVADHLFDRAVVVAGTGTGLATVDVRYDPAGGGCNGAVVELTVPR